MEATQVELFDSFELPQPSQVHPDVSTHSAIILSAHILVATIVKALKLAQRTVFAQDFRKVGHLILLLFFIDSRRIFDQQCLECGVSGQDLCP